MPITPQKKEEYRAEQERDWRDMDFDVIGDTDIKINPDFYIHTALLRAQKCLLKDDVKAGFLSYKVFIEHIETLCSAANMLQEDYAEKIQEYRSTLKEDESLAKEVKVCNEKLRLMMVAVFDNKQVITNLKTR